MFMNNPQISVIIPIYKAESTLLRCLDSIKNQTFKDFEVLMIDDGSPDSCADMIDAYAKTDNRFKPFHKLNGGVSSARQFGIDNACGEYSIHADPDDWVEPTMLEELYKKAKEDDADMVICDYFENTYKGQKYVNQRPSRLDTQVLLKEVFSNLHGSVWNKLIKRVCYQKYNVQFPRSISLCEDQYVVASLLKNEITVCYLPKAFYHYVREIDQHSLSRMYTVDTLKMDIHIRDLFYELLKDSSISKEVYEKKTYGIVSRAFYGGKYVFSSNEFKKCFMPYKPIIKKKQKRALAQNLSRPMTQ